MALAVCLAFAPAAPAQPGNGGSPAGEIFNPAPPSEAQAKRELFIPYRDALRRGQLSQAEKDVINKMTHFQVHQLIAPGKELERNRNMQKLMTDIRSQNTSPGARDYLLSQITFRAGQLLDVEGGGSPAAARKANEAKMIGAMLLSELNVSFNPDIPYVGAADQLMRALSLPDSFIEAKIWAADGLSRILRNAPPNALPVLKRLEITTRIDQEIQRLRSVRGTPEAPNTVGANWLMWNLVEGLGNSERVYDAGRTQIYADTLLSVLADGSEDFLTRARAAHALSRLPYEPTTNLGALNYEVARYTYDLAKTYNANLAGGNPWPLWRRAALHVYLAYEARTAAERTENKGLMYQAQRAGLNGYQTSIQGARNVVLPILNVLIENPQLTPQIPQNLIANLETWLIENPPGNSKLTPESKVTAPPALQKPQPAPSAQPTPPTAGGPRPPAGGTVNATTSM